MNNDGFSGFNDNRPASGDYPKRQLVQGMSKIKELPDARKGWFVEPKAGREIGKTMEVVVLKVDSLRTLWETGQKKPRCYSDDGIVPAARVQNPISQVCEGCEFEKKDLIYRVFCYDVADSAKAGEAVIFTIDCKSTQLKAVRAFVQAVRSKGKSARDYRVTLKSQEQENAKGSWYVVQFENFEVVPSNVKEDIELAYKAVTGDMGDDEEFNDAGSEPPQHSDEDAPF